MSKIYFFLKDIDTSHVAEDKREAWMPKGQVPYFDPVMRRTFESRREKRAFMREHGFRECGERINPSKPIGGREKSRPRPEAEAIKRHLAASGGTEGLLRRIQEGRGVFL